MLGCRRQSAKPPNHTSPAIPRSRRAIRDCPPPAAVDIVFPAARQCANRVGATETTFSHRDALCEWGCDAVWLDPTDDSANILWAHQMAGAMRWFTSGSDYVNHIGLEAEEG